IVSIFQRTRDNSANCCPGVSLANSVEEILENRRIELVIITSPNESHFDLAMRSLLAGKHVVVEKPFTVSSGQARQLIDASTLEGRILTVFHNRRYVNDFLTICRILQEDLLGPIVQFEAHYDRYRPEARPNAWREKKMPGSGILFDIGSHLIDQALILFGSPNLITADVRKQRAHAAVDDYIDLKLDYGNMIVILKAGMLVREPGPRYMIHGSRGSYVKFGDDPQEALLRSGIKPNIPKWGEENREQWGILHTELHGKTVRTQYPSIPGNFGQFYLDLFHTLNEGANLKVKPEHGHNVVRIIELCQESSQMKCTVPCSGLLPSNY
ncbi:MAG TPA: Gfo/Idh/MocA family oxidoreductase, partial [Puia sp.]|nr:Gfo/Idh/MocA family oxidoreductase [Puia sp.]